MSQPLGTMTHPATGVTIQAWKGFSFPAFFFPWIWLMVKGMYVEGLITLLVYWCFPGVGTLLASIFWGFAGNKWHVDHMTGVGFKFPVKNDIGILHGE